jgi:hypothetical protein
VSDSYLKWSSGEKEGIRIPKWLKELFSMGWWFVGSWRKVRVEEEVESESKGVV